MKAVVRFLAKLIPGVLQVAVVAGFFITAAIAYNLGARRAAPSSSPAATTPASRPTSTHPIDENGDGIIYVAPMDPQFQQDEPGLSPMGMELVPMDVSRVDAPGDPNGKAPQAEASHPVDADGDGAIYTCAMHPQIMQDEPGDCPLCGMDLVRVDVEGEASGSAEGDPTRRLTMSREAMALASIQTSPVISTIPRKTLRLVGELAVDPSRRAHISADVGGRVDRLAAEYAGDEVEQGEELVLLYSPELLAVQQEFLQAKGALERLPAGALEAVARASEGAVEAARERLRLAGLSSEQIDAIAASGMAREQITLHAPIGGTVIERHVEEGQYVMKGERILTIADLEVLWAEMAAYEGDLPWLRVGQPVTFTSEASPGHEFKGEVAWIDPMTNTRTRTTRVRLNVDNKGGMLRPGMYLTARVESTLGDTARLVIPSSAPLVTGERAIVYLEVPGAKGPTYQGVEVVLGPRVQEGYVVEEGLAEGQRVVTNGAFQIDSALQIIARPSMMNPAGGIAMTVHEAHGSPPMKPEVPEDGAPAPTSRPSAGQEPHPGDHADIPAASLIEGYLRIQRALAADDFERARDAWRELVAPSPQLLELVGEAGSLADIEALRMSFDKLTKHVVARLQAHEGDIHRELRLVHCPMAFDFAGADWLQAEDEVQNPYFGAAMLSCGTFEQEWPRHD